LIFFNYESTSRKAWRCRKNHSESV